MLMKSFFSTKKKSILFNEKYKLFKPETENIDCYFEYGVDHIIMLSKNL